MKLTKLLEIDSELTRFKKRLDAAIEKAKNDNLPYHDGVTWHENPTDKPAFLKECIGGKESASLKRSATDLKQILYSLNKD